MGLAGSEEAGEGEAGTAGPRVLKNERRHGKSEADPTAWKRAPALLPCLSPRQTSLPLSRNPMVTGTSVLGVKFEGGVVIAADMLGSYGSLARFRNISRIMRVNDSTMLGASGDYADFQYLKQVLGQMV